MVSARPALATLAALIFTTLSLPALAHPGHVATEAGHSHWVAAALVAIALAVVAAFVVTAIPALRRRLSARFFKTTAR